MSRYNWTTREVAIVREHYPLGGVAACLPHLTRSRGSIYQRANALGLRAPGETGVRESWPNDPEIDARIRKLHETPLLKGAITEFAARIGRPKWYVSRRARELGLKTPRFKEAAWSQDEIQLLHDTSHIGTAAARKRFLKEGFNRSETAIHVKRKRLGVSVRQSRQDAGLYAAHAISELFGVDAKTTLRWIRMGELRAKRRDTDTDEYVVAERDLREFIITHPMRVELRKIPDSNRAWFIELLAGRAGLAVDRAA